MEKGFYHPDHGYWQTTGDPSPATRLGYPAGTVEVPLKPVTGRYNWDGTAWAETSLTPEEVEAMAVEWRKAAVLPRRAFCIACFRAGLLTGPEAEDAARGGWPAAFASALSYLTAAQQTEARIEWGAVSEVRRDAPLLELVKWSAGVADEQLDALFGWEVPT
jgi:hypothetical protein